MKISQIQKQNIIKNKRKHFYKLKNNKAINQSISSSFTKKKKRKKKITRNKKLPKH